MYTSNNKIVFGASLVEIIYNPRLKNSYIRINHDNSISVKTPYRSKSFIQELLDEKSLWIQKQLKKNLQREIVTVNIEDEVLLFGDIYSIDSNEASLLREKLHRVKNTNRDNILKIYDDFYKEIAQKYLTQEVQKYAAIMNLEYSELKFRKMRRRWGSCSSKRVITLNTHLMKLQKSMISYVVVHELAHLVHMNHSKKFHALVEYYLPNAKAIRKELKECRVLS